MRPIATTDAVSCPGEHRSDWTYKTDTTAPALGSHHDLIIHSNVVANLNQIQNDQLQRSDGTRGHASRMES